MIRLHPRPVAVLTATAALAVAIAGCTATPPPAPSEAAPEATSSAPLPEAGGSAASPSAPALSPTGSATENLPLFTQLVSQVWGGADQAAGRAYIDALVAGGFDKTAMQVTPDQTVIGNPAESIEFSVRWGEECLVGQVGPSIGDPVTAVLPGLSTGGCLIGQTRPIDW